MDKELKAAQRIIKILADLDTSQRSNVIDYVARRSQQEFYNEAKNSAVVTVGTGAIAGPGY